MTADTAPAASPVEYYYMVTVVRGATTSTRDGIVTATPASTPGRRW